MTQPDTNGRVDLPALFAATMGGGLIDRTQTTAKQQTTSDGEDESMGTIEGYIPNEEEGGLYGVAHASI